MHGRAPREDEPLALGDHEAALLAGLSRSRRNTLARRFFDSQCSEQRRAAPTGYALRRTASGRLLCEPDRPELVEGGHAWHGQEVVRRLLAAGGLDALQVRMLSPPAR